MNFFFVCVYRMTDMHQKLLESFLLPQRYLYFSLCLHASSTAHIYFTSLYQPNIDLMNPRMKPLVAHTVEIPEFGSYK